jgi:AmiR/NasT family two-component response regulator
MVKGADLEGSIVVTGTCNGFEEDGVDLVGFLAGLEEAMKQCFELGADIILVGVEGDKHSEAEAVEITPKVMSGGLAEFEVYRGCDSSASC